jgi:hypothetical protein
LPFFGWQKITLQRDAMNFPVSIHCSHLDEGFFLCLVIEFPQMSPDNQMPDKCHFSLGEGQGSVHPIQCIMCIVDENSPSNHAGQLIGLRCGIGIHRVDSGGDGRLMTVMQSACQGKIECGLLDWMPLLTGGGIGVRICFCLTEHFGYRDRLSEAPPASWFGCYQSDTYARSLDPLGRGMLIT